MDTVQFTAATATVCLQKSASVISCYVDQRSCTHPTLFFCCWWKQQQNNFNHLNRNFYVYLTTNYLKSSLNLIQRVSLWSAGGAAAVTATPSSRINASHWLAPICLSLSHPDILASVAMHPFCIPSGSHFVSWRCISAPVTGTHGQFRHHRQNCC